MCRAPNRGGRDELLCDSLVSTIERNVGIYGHRRLYTWLSVDGKEVGTLTFVQLRDKARAICWALRHEWGAQLGDRALLVYPPGLEFITGFFGCQYAGITAVPYYPPVFPATLMPSTAALKLLEDGLCKVHRIVERCTPRLVMSSTSYLRAKAVASVLLRGKLQWPRLPTYASDNLPSVGPSVAERDCVEEIIDARCSPQRQVVPAFLQFTSGSTGHPKGVVVGESQVLDNVRAIWHCGSAEMQRNWRSLCAEDRVCVVNWVPQYHDMGLIGNIMLPALLGMRGDLMSPVSFLQRPACWLEAISRLRDSHEVVTSAPDFAYALVVRKVSAAARQKLWLGHVYAAMNGAEPVRASTLHSFNDAFEPCGFSPAAWLACLGIAENVVYVAGFPEEASVVSLDRSQLGVGQQPLMGGANAASGQATASVLESVGIVVLPEQLVGWQVAIVHPERRERLADGTVGEVWISGCCVAAGYWGQEELTQQTFHATLAGDGGGCAGKNGLSAQVSGSPEGRRRFLRTGDLGFINHGRLHLVGRSKDLLIVHGRNLHAHDVEACAESACSALRPGCCAAFTAALAAEEEQLVLMAELRIDGSDEELEGFATCISKAVREEHGGVSVSAVVLLKQRSILKTTSGKLRRIACRAAYAQLVAWAQGKEPRALPAADTIPLDRVLLIWLPHLHNAHGSGRSVRPQQSRSHGLDGSLRQQLGGSFLSVWQLVVAVYYVMLASLAVLLGLGDGLAMRAKAAAYWRLLLQRLDPVCARCEASAAAAGQGNHKNGVSATHSANGGPASHPVNGEARAGVLNGHSTKAAARGMLSAAADGVPTPHANGLARNGSSHTHTATLTDPHDDAGRDDDAGVVPVVAETLGEQAGLSLEEMHAMVQEVLGSDLPIDYDVPLMEAGVDSQSAVELRDVLCKRLGGVELDETLLFDYPTLRDMHRFVSSLGTSQQHRVASLAAGGGQMFPSAMGPARICGLSCRAPGAATGVSDLCRVAATGGVVVDEVPSSRWDVYALPPLEPLVRSRALHGAFVREAERFDNARFGVSPAEAAAMDPQQRWLLEHGFSALHAAGYERDDLVGSLTGVFLGIAANDFATILARSPPGGSVYAATGSSHSIAVGRTSYVLGLQGPSVAFDTACSASLAAAHAALRAVQLGECTAALSSAVNAMLIPEVSVAFATAGMTSPNGLCHTFDARADGYVRSEACTAFVLCPSADAAAETDLAVVSAAPPCLRLVGSAIRQDGRSASLTAPNGQSQQALLLAALEDAAMSAPQLSLIEAHGTGTALGDPIEARSLSGAVLSDRAGCEALAVGGMKANAGHAEPAAGAVGLLKLALALCAPHAAPNAQLRVINPHVSAALRSTSCALPTQLSPLCLAVGDWAAAAGGVSSFGYNGTIAHAVLRATRSASTPRMPQDGLSGVSFRRRTFRWCRAVHPLLQHRLPPPTLSADAEDAVVFRSRALGLFSKVIGDHIVQGRIVAPAASQMEMVHAAVVALHGQRDAGARLATIAFVSPLVVGEALSDPQAQPVVECVLRRGTARFEVRSGVLNADGQPGEWLTHSTGEQGAAWPSAWMTPPDVAHALDRCTEPVDVAAFYRALSRSGVTLLSDYQSVERAMASEAGEVLANIATRRRRRGTHLHPGDFDALLQLALAFSAEPGSEETRLPFAVDEAQLRRARPSSVQRFAHVAPRRGVGSRTTGDSCLFASSGTLPHAQLRNLHCGVLKVQAPPSAMESIGYETHWVPSDIDSSVVPVDSSSRFLCIACLPGSPECLTVADLVPVARHAAPSPPEAVPLATVVAVALSRARHATLALVQLEAVLRIVQSQTQGAAGQSSALWLLSAEALTANSCSHRGAAGSPAPVNGLAALSRSARQEVPMLRLRHLSVANAGEPWARTIAAATQLSESDKSGPIEPELALFRSAASHPRLSRCRGVGPDGEVLDELGGHLLTGGTGGLGLMTARWLAKRGASSLVLASRSGAVSRRAMLKLRGDANGAPLRVFVERCDVAELTDVARLLARVQLELPLRGVWHAAGVLADRTLPQQNARSLLHVFAPKAAGSALLLQGACAAAPLRECVLFSSIASLLGSAGQANYSAANSCLDSLSAHRRSRGQNSLSVQWGPWDEAGMAAGGAVNARLKAMGIGLIATSVGFELLRSALCSPHCPVLAAMPVSWERVGPAVPPFLYDLAPRVPDSASAFAAVAGSAGHIGEEEILAMVQRTAGSAVDADTPLMEAGLDSLGAVELRNQLQQASGQTLPATVIFDRPTVRALAELFEPGDGADAEVAMELAPRVLRHSDSLIRVTGLSAKLPGPADSVSAFEQAAERGVNVVGQVPLSRYDASEIASGMGVDDAVASRLRFLAALSNVELFDYRFFGVALTEVNIMDPQQRLLLEYGYAAVHDAGLERRELLGTDMGVFLGIAAGDWSMIATNLPGFLSVYAATAAAHSVAAGRLSFTLGVQGSCLAIDTACSSTLAAAHSAVSAIRSSESRRALLAGVNAILTHHVSLAFAIATMTSATGACHTWNDASDGFARGEFCGAAMLEDSSADDAPAMCLVGSSCKQDGKSASLTAPNGQAQHALLRAALHDASMAPTDLGSVEAHGTGTALGDPIEARSLAGAVLKSRSGCEALALGGMKANSGHAEPAAGAVGFIKLVLALQSKRVAPNARLRVLNPMVEASFTGVNCGLPTQLSLLPRVVTASGAAACGVSSFGYSGTIAHSILRGRPQGSPTDKSRPPLPPLIYKRQAFPWREAPTPARKQTRDRIASYRICWTPPSGLPEPTAAVRKKPTSWLLMELVESSNRAAPVKSELASALNGSAKHVHSIVPRTGPAPNYYELLQVSSWDTVALVFGRAPGAESLLSTATHATFSTLELVRALLKLTSPARLLLCTPASMCPAPSRSTASLSSASLGCVWGLSRAVRLECPSLLLNTVDVAAGPFAAAAAAVALSAGQCADFEVVWDGPRILAPQLRRWATIPTGEERIAPSLSGSYLISGGLGGLGLTAADALLASGAAGVVLASRTGRIVRGAQGLEQRLSKIMRSGADVATLSCDMSVSEDCVAALRVSLAMHAPIAGVLHAAGVGTRGLVGDVSAAEIQYVFRPKLGVAVGLHCGSGQLALRSFICYSSVAAALGNIGQSSYAAANGSLDSLSTVRRSVALASLSLQLPLVSEVGMGAAAFSGAQLTFSGLSELSLDQYVSALFAALAGLNLSGPSSLPLPALPASALQYVSDAAQERFAELAACLAPDAATAVADGPHAGDGGRKAESNELSKVLQRMPQAQRLPHVAAMVLHTVQELTGFSGLEVETPLMDAGIDSLAATELVNRLRMRVGIALPPTLIFEQPTPRAIAAYVVEKLCDEQGTAQVPHAAHDASKAATAEGVIGISKPCGRWPGDVTSAAAFRELVATSGDAITAVPAIRWRLSDAVAVEELTDRQLSCVKHGGFVRGAELFDNATFGISVAESTEMDPQQRLLLEVAYQTLSSSGSTRASLLGSLEGVFVGIERPDWALLHALAPPSKQSVYAVTGDMISVAAGRLSFVLGLNGPCVSIDTACASALVALHAASSATRSGECVSAVATAVSLKLAPQPTLAAASAGMLSEEGRCKTFDERASGYVRSEGIGAARVHMASSGGDLQLLGCSVRQDGRSASLTAPNGSAQRALLLRAWALASLSEGVAGIEAHGTGTPLGDPTEAGALAAAVRASKGMRVVAGAAKASVGHAEAPSGQAGLLKTLVQLRGGVGGGNAMLRAVNPLVRDRLSGEALPLVLLNTQTTRIEAAFSGISTFGYSGTIAHGVFAAKASEPLTAVLLRSSPARLLRRRFAWASPCLAESKVTDGALLSRAVPFLGAMQPSSGTSVVWEQSFSPVELAHLQGHRVGQVPLLPGTCYVEMARAMALALYADCTTFALRQVDFRSIIFLDECELLGVPVIRLSYDRADGTIAITSRLDSGAWDTHATMLLVREDDPPATAPGALEALASTREGLPEHVDGTTFYANTGNDYQGEFRSMREAWGGPAAEAVGRVEYDMEETRRPYLRTCAWLDACTHAPLWWIDHRRRPFFASSVRAYRVLPAMHAAPNRLLWGHLVAPPTDSHTAEGTVDMLDEAGRRLVRIEGTSAGFFEAGWLEGRRVQQHMYQVQWQKSPAVPETSAGLKSPALLITDASWAGLLGAEEPSPSIESRAGLVVFALPLQSGRAALRGLPVLEAALGTLQAQDPRSPVTTVLLSNGASMPPSYGSTAIAHSGVVGLSRAARQEQPWLSLVCVDAEECSTELLQSAAQHLSEGELALRGSTAYIARLVRVPMQRGAMRLHLPVRGAIASIQMQPQQPYPADIGADEAEMRVHAVGLNFRDVLNVLGLYPGDPGPPGGDCSGVVSLLGSTARQHLSPADPVFGFAIGSLASVARTLSDYLVRKPAALDFEAACTLPITWSTTHVSFGNAQLRNGEAALLHAIAGGVGLVAAEYANWLSVQSLGSAGRPYKHALARKVGRTSSSRDASAGAFGLMQLLRSARVHLVLNSLSLDFIATALGLLVEGGSFEEIGKRGVWRETRVSAAAAAVRYDAVQVDMDIMRSPPWVRNTLSLLSARAGREVLRGLPVHVFDFEAATQQAFRFLQSGRNIGKVVIRMAAAPASNPQLQETTHLLTGGTGGLGLMTASWLSKRGARSLVLASRSGKISARAAAQLQSNNADDDAPPLRVLVERCDVAERTDVARLLARVRLELPLRGVWHAAGVLADRTLPQQTARSLLHVYAPKAAGSALLLQGACAAAPLRECVLFSSIASLLGSAGQANYSAANSCLDSLSVHRRSRGQNSLSVQWGPWDEAGMAAGGAVNARLRTAGFGLITSCQGFAALYRALLNDGLSLVAAAPVRWATLLHGSNAPPLLQLVAPRGAGGASASAVRPPTSSVGLDDLLTLIGRTVGGSIDADTPLLDAGLDSLGAVELRNQLLQATGVQSLPNTLLFDYPTPRGLAHALSLHDTNSAAAPSDAVAAKNGPFSADNAPMTPAALAQQLRTPYGSDSLLVRIADSPPAAGDQLRPRLIIMHSLSGDASGYDRLLEQFNDRQVDALVHAGVRHGDETCAPSTVPAMASLYAEAIVADSAGVEFDLMGASFGALVAHQIAWYAARAGGRPRRLVLIDPPPFAPPFSLSYGQSLAATAAVTLLANFKAILGSAEDSDAQLHDEDAALISGLPEDALPAFIAHRLATMGFIVGDARDTLSFSRKLRVQMQSMASVKRLYEDPAEFRMFDSSAEGPSVMLLLSSQRRQFWLGYGFPSEIRCETPAYSGYGAAALSSEVPGGHFSAIAKCLGHRVPELTAQIRNFLSAQTTVQHTAA